MFVFKRCVNYLEQIKPLSKVYNSDLSVYHADSDGDSGKKRHWKDSVIDALIISGLTFFSTLGGDSITGLNTSSALKASAVASGVQFFIFLALKRGIGQTKKHVPHYHH